jgi:hypothetical protein
MEDRLVLMLYTSWALVLQAANLTGSWGRRALSVVAAFTPERLICGRGRRRAASVAVIDIVFHVLVELLEKKCALETHLLDAAIQAQDALAGRVVGLFNVVDAPAEVDAFAVISTFD